MLQINENGMVYGEEIHQAIESKTSDFSTWMKRAIHRADLQKDKDFTTNLLKSTGGRPKIQYEFKLIAAKEICITEGNEKGKQIRRWLIELDKQKENLDLLTHDQVVMLSVLEGFFKYGENQKDIEKKHCNHFVNNSKAFNPYAKFHRYRNQALNIEPEILNERLKEYCIYTNRSMPKLKTKYSKIQFLNTYENLKIAVWDFLEIKGEINSLKLANLVKRMSEAKNLQLYTKNEDNIFQQRENITLKSLNS